MTLGELQKVFFAPSSESRLAPEDFFVLLAHATGKPKEWLLAHPEHALAAETETRARGYFARRLTHEPVAYIVGHREFFGRDFLVTPDTLIPRPETELLVEQTLDSLKNHTTHSAHEKQNGLIVIDIGAGSGAIIVSIVAEIGKHRSENIDRETRLTFVATDTSAAALRVARENAKRHQVEKEIIFIASDLLSSVPETFLSGDGIVIAANLPYLSEALYATADEDVRTFEPPGALVSGRDGLDHYRRLLNQIRERLPPDTPVTLGLEISPEQSRPIRSLIQRVFPRSEVRIVPDLAGRDRVVITHLRAVVRP